MSSSRHQKKRERITLISVLLLLCTFGQRARPGRFSPNTSQAWLRSLLRLQPHPGHHPVCQGPPAGVCDCHPHTPSSSSSRNPELLLKCKSEQIAPRLNSLPGLPWSVQSVGSLTQSCPTRFMRPHELQHARPPCPSPTPGVYSNPSPSSR